jgi:hypothetical protein
MGKDAVLNIPWTVANRRRILGNCKETGATNGHHGPASINSWRQVRTHLTKIFRLKSSAAAPRAKSR